jgi:hypothetical protein
MQPLFQCPPLVAEKNVHVVVGKLKTRNNILTCNPSAAASELADRVQHHHQLKGSRLCSCPAQVGMLAVL